MCRFCLHEALLQIQETIKFRFDLLDARLDIILMEIIRHVREKDERRM